MTTAPVLLVRAGAFGVVAHRDVPARDGAISARVPPMLSAYTHLATSGFAGLVVAVVLGLLVLGVALTVLKWLVTTAAHAGRSFKGGYREGPPAP